MKAANSKIDANAPLGNLDEWEDFLKQRYPEGAATPPATFKANDPEKKKEQFRNYEADARPSVREFYRLNHRYQTYDFVQEKKKDFLCSSLIPCDLSHDYLLHYPFLRLARSIAYI